MNIEDYFKIISTTNNVFRFEFKGFFKDSVVDKIGDEIKRRYFRAVDSFLGKPFITYADLRGLHAMPPKGRAMVSELMSYGKQRNLFFSININPSAVSTLSIHAAGNISLSNELRIIVTTQEEAESILEEKVAEMKNSV